MRQTRDFTPDALLQLKDAGLVAADAAAQVGGTDRIVDLGAARMDGRVIMDVTAIEVASGDEVYRIRTEFSNSPTFASGIVNGPEQVLGDSTLTLASADSTVGRYELAFTNEVLGVQYRYMRLRTDVAGAIATGINYTAWIGK